MSTAAITALAWNGVISSSHRKNLRDAGLRCTTGLRMFTDISGRAKPFEDLVAYA